MWIEKMIIEIVGEDSKISSFIIMDRTGEPMLLSEQRDFGEYDHLNGIRTPFTVILSESDVEVITYPNKTPESFIKTGDVCELHIRWLYIPLKKNYSAVCYWLRLPKDAVITEVRKYSPLNSWNYAILKDDESRNLWLRCMFSKEETHSLSFNLKYTIDENRFDKYEQKESLHSWKDDLEHVIFGESNKSILEKVLTILEKFLHF